ncbi:FdtA/QdtA family cupin domain-containing protein [Candidatus Gracilibacteria bacterium]|nr:FdtA/QdtA family cupin domain-containing protein [Candidatus Gracilibacteria bacterium]
MNVQFWRLPVFSDGRGSLSVAENTHLPFPIKRVYFLFDTKEMRGGHAHRKEQEVFICVSGSFKAKIHDGKRWKSYTLNKPGQALYTGAMIWHQFEDFSDNAIMLALSSTSYEGQKGYIVDLELFKKTCKKRSS